MSRRAQESQKSMPEAALRRVVTALRRNPHTPASLRERLQEAHLRGCDLLPTPSGWRWLRCTKCGLVVLSSM